MPLEIVKSTPLEPKRKVVSKEYLGCLVPIFLILLPVIGIAWYNIWAKSEYLNHLKELEELGESLDPLDFAPAPVTDDSRNLAKAPIMVRLLEEHTKYDEPHLKQGTVSSILDIKSIPGYKNPGSNNRETRIEFPYLHNSFPGMSSAEAAKVVLSYFDAHDDTICEFRDAIERPETNFGIQYEKMYSEEFTFYNPLLEASKLIHLKGKSALIQNDEQAALEAILDNFRIYEHLSRESCLLSSLVSYVPLRFSLGITLEGCRQHIWSKSSQVRIDTELQKVQIVSDYLNDMRMERAATVAVLRDFNKHLDNFKGYGAYENTRAMAQLAFVFRGWTYDNASFYSSKLQEHLFMDNGKLLHDRLYHTNRISGIYKDIAHSKVSKIRYSLCLLVNPATEKTRLMCMQLDTMARQTRLALRLLGYYQEHVDYPTELDSILLKDEKDLVEDIVTGAPMIYERIAGWNYQIYSVGANEYDEGGLLKKDRRFGDWVWRLHLPEDFDRDAYFVP